MKKNKNIEQINLIGVDRINVKIVNYKYQCWCAPTAKKWAYSFFDRHGGYECNCECFGRGNTLPVKEIMDNALFNQELLGRLRAGEALILTTAIPNEVVKNYPSEVAFFQYQINVATEQFNDRIKQLKEMEGKKEDMTPVLLKIKKEKEKYEWKLD